MLPLTSPDTSSVPGRIIYQVNLKIEAEKQGVVSGNLTLSNASNPIQLSVVTDSANDQIVSCASSDAEEMCGHLGGNWNPARTPACKTNKGFKFDSRSWTGYLNAWDQPVIRSPVPGLVMTGYDTYHSNGAEDNRIAFQTAEALDGNIPLIFGTCTNTALMPVAYPLGSVNNWDQPVNFTCPGNSYMVNETSVHSNGAEDRRYNYSCCTLRPSTSNQIVLKGECEWSGWENDYDRPVKFECSAGKIMTGVESVHHNGYEDRIYRFQCCGQQ